MKNYIRKKLSAFTLAEVLITLGIIGVVAAMVMPTLSAKIQSKTLESQFKKSISTVQQAVLRAKTDMGIEYFAQYCTGYDSENEVYYNRTECYNAFLSKLVKATDKEIGIWGNNKTAIDRTTSGSNEVFKTYNGKNTITYEAVAGHGYPIYYTYPLPDGSYVNSWIIGGNFHIGIDVNGAKSPNKFGHDIFIFMLDLEKDTLMFAHEPTGSFECSLTSTSNKNGTGCGFYAIKDECPYASSKSYFSCLP